MKKSYKFNVGDRVQFKTWKEMEKEFTLDSDGDIDLKRTCFTKHMKHLCGTTATIDEVGWNHFVKLKHFSSKGDTLSWEFVTDMLKPVEEAK